MANETLDELLSAARQYRNAHRVEDGHDLKALYAAGERLCAALDGYRAEPTARELLAALHVKDVSLMPALHGGWHVVPDEGRDEPLDYSTLLAWLGLGGEAGNGAGRGG